MSEWMTTGQMIDELEIGERAVSDKNTEVFCKEDGQIIHVTEHLLPNEFILTQKFRNFKWRILPNYVSFDEAMQAHKKKKTVAFHHQDIIYTFEHSLCPEQFEDIYRDSIALHELINGKWTIEDE